MEVNRFTEKENKKRTRKGESNVATPSEPCADEVVPKRRHHGIEGKCVACQQRDRARMGFIAKASASQGTGGPCFPAPQQYVDAR